MTPIYFKTTDDVELPKDESAFLLLSGNGLWMCRNHEFFRSCAPARSWPCELANHKASLELRHPKISRRIFELIVGFFSAVAERHAAEAGVLLIWDKAHELMELFVPRQLATVGKTWSGELYPIGLRYDRPTDLGPERLIIADFHSHVYDAAYSSSQDKYDEEYLPGLHVVVGRLHREPPDFHIEFVVDGYRFKVSPEQVLEGYKSRSDDVPQAWLDLVSIKICGPGNTSTTTNGWSTTDRLPPPPKNYPADDGIIGESK